MLDKVVRINYRGSNFRGAGPIINREWCNNFATWVHMTQFLLGTCSYYYYWSQFVNDNCILRWSSSLSSRVWEATMCTRTYGRPYLATFAFFSVVNEGYWPRFFGWISAFFQFFVYFLNHTTKESFWQWTVGIEGTVDGTQITKENHDFRPTTHWF